MPQFFVEPEALRGTEIIIRGKEARHLSEVLRLGLGDWVVLCDGQGARYRAEITETRPLHVQLRRGERLPNVALTPEVTVAAAIIRPQRFDWMVEKLFELGCRRLIPMTTERSVAHYIKDEPKQHARWSEIALSAAKQSGLPWMPEVAPLTSLADVLKNPSGQLLYCWEGSAIAAEILSETPTRGPVTEGCLARSHGSPYRTAELGTGARLGDSPPVPPLVGVSSLTAHQKKTTGPTEDLVTILIGPEGGFSNTEHDSIMSHSPIFLSLGPLILRSETAVLAAMVKVMS